MPLLRRGKCLAEVLPSDTVVIAFLIVVGSALSPGSTSAGDLLVADTAGARMSEGAVGFDKAITSSYDVKFKDLGIEKCHSDQWSAPYDVAAACPLGWTANFSSTQCCLVRMLGSAEQLRSAETNTTVCCPRGACLLSGSRARNHSFLCVAPLRNRSGAATANSTLLAPEQRRRGGGAGNVTGVLRCCSTVCCVADAYAYGGESEQTNTKHQLIVILSLVISGSALIVILSALYMYWRQLSYDDRTIKISPMKRRYEAIRMSPPAMKMRDRDPIDPSELIFPPKSSRTAKTSPRKIASVRMYGQQGVSAPALDSSVLHLSSQEPNWPYQNGPGGVEIDMPFVSRTRVQPASAMQNIIPK